MTMAREKRTENFQLAVKLLLDAVGDRALDEVSFRAENYKEILTTAWEEMQTFGLLEALGPTGEFIFTGRGWTAAVLSAGARKDKAFTERLQRLFSVMKGFVKGRKEPVVVAMRELVDRTGLPEGWIFNIIEGKYLEEVSKRRGAAWVKTGRLVSIPMGFGVEPTDLQSLVNAEMLQKVEELEEELQVSKDDLGRLANHGDELDDQRGGLPLPEGSF